MNRRAALTSAPKRDLPHHDPDGAPGVAILMISSELPEVVGMSDRVYVMREGSIAGELQAGDISRKHYDAGHRRKRLSP